MPRGAHAWQPERDGPRRAGQPEPRPLKPGSPGPARSHGPFHDYSDGASEAACSGPSRKDSDAIYG